MASKKYNLINELLFYLALVVFIAAFIAVGVFGWWLFEELTGYTAGLFEIANSQIPRG